MPPDTVVVAGLSARMLAESARQAGWRAIALDLFGDADTRRACAWWRRIGDAAACAIAPARLREALEHAAREPGVIGWIAGSGFEGIPDALEAGGPGLPLLGMPVAAVRRLRDPADFFATLDRLGLAHPPVCFQPPSPAEGWLRKSFGGSGAWHIRPADPQEGCGAQDYYQRVQAGEARSALFLADGAHARIVALNRLLVRPLGALPFLYMGAIGPLRDAALTRTLQDALDRLVPAFGLRGLASLDFLAQAGEASLLEINPRPSATMALHGRDWPGGLLRAHVLAVRGILPAIPAVPAPGLRGCLTVFADRPCRVGLGLAAELTRSPHCHDLPAPGERFLPGQPVCTVSAQGTSEEAVLSQLDARAAQVLRSLRPLEERA